MKYLALIATLFVFLSSCKKETPQSNEPTDFDSIPAEYVPNLFNDPNFRVFPISGAKWYRYVYYQQQNLISSVNDTCEITSTIQLDTRTILQNQFDTASALPASLKTYYQLKAHGYKTFISYLSGGGQGLNTSGPYTDLLVANFRIDSLDNAVYQQFTHDNKSFEAKIMDFDWKVNDTIKYLRRETIFQPPYGGNYLSAGDIVIIQKDSFLFDNKWLKKFKVRNTVTSSQHTITQGALPLFFYTSYTFPQEQYIKFVYNGDTLTN